MQVFLHYKTQQLEGFLEQMSELNYLFSSKSIQFSKSFLPYLNEVIEYFKQVGDSVNQASVEQIRNYYLMAVEGVDPQKLEKVSTGRRALTRRSSFHCLTSLTDLLQVQIETDKTKLEEAKKTIGPLVLSLVQAGAITPDELSRSLSQSDLETIWHRVSQNEQVKLHERNLKLNITQEDIFLLFAEVMDQIKD